MNPDEEEQRLLKRLYEIAKENGRDFFTIDDVQTLFEEEKQQDKNNKKSSIP